MEETEKRNQAEEKERLAFILSILENRLDQARAKRDEQLSGLQDTRRDEFTERSEPMLKNLWAAHRFEDLVHLPGVSERRRGRKGP